MGKRKPRKIALVGTSGTANEAPYHDPDFEIWGVSGKTKEVLRHDRWFELHRLDGEPVHFQESWRAALKSFVGDKPLYMIYPEPGLVENVVQYPADRMLARFGTFFMTSTFSWMMALAIDEMRPNNKEIKNRDEIFICGVDMEAGTEYSQQRAGLRHFIELAKLLGIKVTRLGESGISYDPIPYPMWQDDPLMAKVEWRRKKTVEELAKLEVDLRTNRETRAFVSGQLDVMAKHQTATLEQLAGLEQQKSDLLRESSNISQKIIAYQAQLEEQEWLLAYLKP